MRDNENSYLSLEPREESALEGLLGHSSTYRIAIGPPAGRKAFTLQTVPASPTLERDNPWLAKAAGFSLHAGVAAGTDQRDKVERLCRYIARPAIASGRLVLTGQGDIRYPLQTPYRDGTTHVIFQPLDCMARRAALVPKPRVHLTRYHGVFAPHRRWRTAVTAAQRGAGKSPAEIKSAAERQRAMTWAQRRKRVFRIAIERCARCGGKLKVIASIEDPALIGRILQHREPHWPSPATTAAAHPARGPPPRVLDLS